MKISRGQALTLLGGALALPSCARQSGRVIRVGSKNFSENITIAQVYAGALERANLQVERRMNLGSTQIAQAALERGDIDLYPEYTGTGLIDVLHLTPMHDAARLFERVRKEYRARYDLIWLQPSPVNDSQALAVTRAVSKRFRLRTLSECAREAPQLRLAAVPEFVVRADALPGLQRYYGGFNFASVRTFEIGLQYQALLRGDADVCTAFTTDAQIAAQDLVVLQDDRHFWPPYNVAPVVRAPALAAHPQIAQVLDRIAPLLTDTVVRAFNVAVDIDKRDPRGVADRFLAEHAR